MHALSRTITCVVAMAMWLTGCGHADEQAMQRVDVIVLYDDNTAVRMRLPLDDRGSYADLLRPILASAFHPTANGPNVERWLIDDSRAWSFGELDDGRGGEIPYRATISMYRDYRVVPRSSEVSAIGGIEHRTVRDEPWRTRCGIPNAETGLQRAIYYLNKDLRDVQWHAGLLPDPSLEDRPLPDCFGSVDGDLRPPLADLVDSLP